MLGDLYMEFLLFDFSCKWFLATFLLCCFVAFTIVFAITFLRVFFKLLFCIFDIIRLWGE